MTDEPLMSRKDVALWLNRSISYVDAMICCGFRMVAGRTTKTAVIAFLSKTPEPCKAARLVRRKQAQ